MKVCAVSFALRTTALVGTASVRAAVEASGGDITHAHELASWAIALTVEIAEAELPRLHAELERIGAVWLNGAESLLGSGGAGEAALVLLHVEFTGEDMDRRVKVPAVPG